jgi:hypothetical protein
MRNQEKDTTKAYVDSHLTLSQPQVPQNSSEVLTAVTSLAKIQLLEGSRYRNFKVVPGSFILKLAEGVDTGCIPEIFQYRVEEIDGFFTTVFRKKDLPEVLPLVTEALSMGKISYLGRGFSIEGSDSIVFPLNRLNIIFNTRPSNDLISSIEKKYSIRASERSRGNRSLHEFTVDTLFGVTLYDLFTRIKSQLPVDVPSVAGVHLETRRRLKAGRGA